MGKFLIQLVLIMATVNIDIFIENGVHQAPVLSAS